jgi:hypothetical protein
VIGIDADVKLTPQFKRPGCGGKLIEGSCYIAWPFILLRNNKLQVAALTTPKQHINMRALVTAQPIKLSQVADF